MSNSLEYKGYIATISFSAEDGCLFGKIEHINDLILFDAHNAEEIENAFHEAVDSYLAFCAEQGKDPSQPFKGSFNIRPGAKLHRQAAHMATRKNMSLNDLVTKALERYLTQEVETHEAKELSSSVVFHRVAFENEDESWAPNLTIDSSSLKIRGACH